MWPTAVFSLRARSSFYLARHGDKIKSDGGLSDFTVLKPARWMFPKYWQTSDDDRDCSRAPDSLLSHRSSTREPLELFSVQAVTVSTMSSLVCAIVESDDIRCVPRPMRLAGQILPNVTERRTKSAHRSSTSFTPSDTSLPTRFSRYLRLPKGTANVLEPRPEQSRSVPLDPRT
jgi:hypothetical protein